MVLHPLGDHGLAELMDRGDQGAHEALQAEGAADPPHQAEIELDGVVPGLANPAVVGEAGAEVVDEQPEIQLVLEPLRRGDQTPLLLDQTGGRGFRELQTEQRRIDPMGAQQGDQLR